MTNQPAAQPVKKSLSAVRVEPQSVAVADGTNGLTIAASEVASQPDTVKVAIPAKKHKPLHPGKDQGDEDQGETEGGHSPSVIHQEAAAEGQSAEAGSAPASEPMSNTADAIGGAALDGGSDSIAAGQGLVKEAREPIDGRPAGGTGAAEVSSAQPGMMDRVFNAAGGSSGLEVLSAAGIGLGALILAGKGSGSSAAATAQKILAVTAGLAPSSETGTSLTDNIINNKTPSLMGNTEAGATVVLTLHGKQYTTTADASGNWTVSVPVADALPDGTYVATVKVTDGAGNIGTGTAGAFLVNTTLALTGDLDVRSDTGINNHDYLTNATNPSYVGTATAGATVTLVLNGKTYTAIADNSGSWAITVPTRDKLADGSYTPQLSASDMAGNTQSLAMPALTVITTIAVTGGLDAASDSGVSHTDNFTSVNLPSFSGTTTAGAIVTLIVNNKTYTATANASGVWALTLPTTDRLADGTYVAQIRAVDGAGNVATLATSPIHIDTTVAVTGGLSYLTDSGANSNDRITGITTPTLAGVTEAGATVVLTLHGKTYTAVADTTGAWNVALPTADALSPGTYTASVQATDLAGNTTTITALPFTVKTTSVFTGALDPASDNATNAASNTAATNSDGHTTISVPNFKGTSDASATIQLSINGKNYTTMADANGNWNLMVPAVDALPPGSYSPTFKETDVAGNVTVLNGAPLVIESGHMPTLTAVNDNVGILQGHLLNGETTDATHLAINGFVDLYSSIDGGTVAIYDGAIQVATAVVNSANGTWTANVNLAAGAHTLTAQYTTAASTPVSTNSAVFNVTVGSADGIYNNITLDTTNPAQHSLVLGGEGRTLNLAATAHAQIDYLDLTGTGANTVQLTMADVLQGGVNLFNTSNGWSGLVAGTRHQMVVTGNAGDTVLLDNASHSADWALAGTTTNAGHVYQVYNSASGLAQLLVEQTIQHAAGGALLG